MIEWSVVTIIATMIPDENNELLAMREEEGHLASRELEEISSIECVVGDKEEVVSSLACLFVSSKVNPFLVRRISYESSFN